MDSRIRTTVSIPARLLRQAEELGRGLGLKTRSEIIRVAVMRWVWEEERKRFAGEILEGGEDLQLKRESEAISKEFECTLADGLDPEDWSEGAIDPEEG